MIPLSPSNMMSYRTCPLRFYGQSISKEIKWKPSPQKSRGTAVHEAIERAVAGRRHPYIDDKQLDIDYVKRQLDALYDLQPADIWIEHEMCVRKNGTQCDFWDEDVWMRSKADIVVRPDSGPVYIVDIKTGKKWDNDCFQLMTEAVIAHLIYQTPRVRYAYWYVDSGETVEEVLSFPYDSGKYSLVLETAVDMETAFQNQHFPAKRNRFCRWCDFKNSGRC